MLHFVELALDVARKLTVSSVVDLLGSVEVVRNVELVKLIVRKILVVLNAVAISVVDLVLATLPADLQKGNVVGNKGEILGALNLVGERGNLGLDIFGVVLGLGSLILRGGQGSSLLSLLDLGNNDWINLGNSLSNRLGLLGSRMRNGNSNGRLLLGKISRNSVVFGVIIILSTLINILNVVHDLHLLIFGGLCLFLLGFTLGGSRSSRLLLLLRAVLDSISNNLSR